MDFIEIVPGKTNLKEYKHGNWKVHQFQDDEMAPGWESMDDTSSWVLNTDEQTVIGQVDWSVGWDVGERMLDGRCDIGSDEVYLDRIDVWDAGKGIGTEVLKRKHKKWADKGYKSVTLWPQANPFKPFEMLPEHQKGSQVQLVRWYKKLGYEDSDKCKDKDTGKIVPNFLTKILG